MPSRAFRRYFPLLLALWMLFVLYPNPIKLIISIHRMYRFDAVPAAVHFMLDDLPSDPVALERAVLARIPYRYDWELYSMPWYFPTIEEVLERREGDCKARALVLASVLKAKNLPYRVTSSPIHMWVEYDGKVETSFENPRVQFFQRDPETGDREFRIPEISLSKVADSGWHSLWRPMPDCRKALLFSGLAALIIARVVLWRRKPPPPNDTVTGRGPHSGELEA